MAILSNETALPIFTLPSSMGSTLKEKNLLQQEAKTSLRNINIKRAFSSMTAHRSHKSLPCFNPIALRKAKTECNLCLSEYKRVKINREKLRCINIHRKLIFMIMEVSNAAINTGNDWNFSHIPYQQTSTNQLL